jgi:ATP-dependent exoDNAse (exonuclease V) alpha subunit
MAIYFLNMKSLGRSSGSSAVSAAAYRAGERIRDERTGRTYDHSDRQGVLHKEIMLPNQFAADKMSWAQDRGNLWNSAERAEIRSDARTAREYLVALPAELSPQARLNLVTGFSRELVERYRFALDIAIHAPRDFPGSDPRNFHAHLLATTREVTRDGLGAKTALEWNDTARRRNGLLPAAGELLHVRERWALAANTALEQAHVNARIDHRTLQAQGIDREPKPHIPRAAFEIERRGHHSVVAERIRAQHQARVEARLQRTAQREPPVATPKSLAGSAKEYVLRWLGHRQAQDAQPKRPEPPSKESARRWKARDGQVQEKSSQDLAKESALRWEARYGRRGERQQDLAKESAQKWLRYRQAPKDAQAQAQAQERERSVPAAASAKRARGLDLSR